MHLPKQFLAKDQSERCFVGCVSHVRPQTADKSASVLAVSAGQTIAARLCLESDPPGTVCSLTSAGHDAGWGWVGRGVYGRAAGVSILAVTLCVCVVLYSFTKHVLSSHSGDFVNHGVTAWSHGSWSTAHAGYAVVFAIMHLYHFKKKLKLNYPFHFYKILYSGISKLNGMTNNTSTS